MNELSVLFIIFNRPDTTMRVFEAIAKAKPSRLFVAADGPRMDREGESLLCQQTRDIIKKVDWDCEVKTLFREKNIGCKGAVSSAITWFFEHVEEGVILEDDCLPSESFFSFCSTLLEHYRDDKRVMMISGNNFQDGKVWGEGSYYFSQLFHIWGWATWRRAWKLYDIDMRLVPEFSKHNLIHDLFVDQNIALHWLDAFSRVRTGVIKTWDYSWVFSCLIQNGLSVVPNRNLVSNIGFGEGATHTKDVNSRLSSMQSHDLEEIMHAKCVACCQSADLYEYVIDGVYPYLEKMDRAYRRKRLRTKQVKLRRIREMSTCKR